jgi:hypothetical protein
LSARRHVNNDLLAASFDRAFLARSRPVPRRDADALWIALERAGALGIA